MVGTVAIQIAAMAVGFVRLKLRNRVSEGTPPSVPKFGRAVARPSEILCALIFRLSRNLVF